jgi:transcriptional regulator with XRE-family HTH domain
MQDKLHNMGNKVTGSKTLGDKIAKRMTEKGLNQSSLSTAVGVGQSRISRFINGNFRRDSDTLKKICKFLDIDSSDFLSDPHSPDNARIQTLTIRLFRNTPPRKAKTIIRLLEEISEL